ncbi:MAG: Ig-like domain-containing protein [Gemmatimonadales bacterium]
MRHARLAAMLAILALVAGCASEGMPPGGPVDTTPPRLLVVSPESGSLHVAAKQTVTFRFDEVIAERTRAGAPLDQAVVVSPTEGAVSVDWHRTYISVRNHKGWRPDVAYTVTMLPGLMDLSGNTTKKPLQTVFSTGTVIPNGEVSGVAFDWVTQRVASGARIEAMTGKDTVLKFTAVADSTGRFVMPTLPSGPLQLRAYVDANRNQKLDSRELWDSASVSLTDTASREFYLFAHDTIGPSITDVTPIDSVTLRVHFDRPLSPTAPLGASQFSLKLRDTTKTDSVPLAVRRVSSAARYDTLAQARKLFLADSTMRADTSAAGRKALVRRDSLARAAALDSASAAQVAAVKASRDTTKAVVLPKPSRPAPLSEFILELAAPLPYDMFGTLSVTDATGLTGHVHHPPRSKQFVLRKPAPRDSAAVKPAKP